MKKIRTLTGAAALALVAGVAPIHAQQPQDSKRTDPRVPPAADAAKAQPQNTPQRQPESKPQPQESRPQPQNRAQPERVAPRQQPAPQPQVMQLPRREPVAQPQQQDVRRVPLSQGEQQQRVWQEQQRLAQYRGALDERTRLLQEQSALLQQQRRLAQYRVQQQYYERLREQQLRLQDDRDFDDAYYYAPNSYQYYRGGSYYETNQYGAQALQRAVNYGYEEGVRAGQADRQDGWPFNYTSSYAYQDANYGYDGYYIGQSDYNYFFRQGFQRGYQDGYSGSFQYGSPSNGGFSMLGSLLSNILGLRSIP